MKHEALEKRLRKKRVIRRSIELGLAILFAVLFFVSFWLLESTAEIVEHDFGYGYTREEKIYNEAFIPLITLGIIGAFACGGILLDDFLICRSATVEVDGYYVTVYRGMFAREVYVDGELTRSIFMEPGYFVEIVLSNGTRVSIAFGRTWYDWCHMSFSNGRPAIEL